ncbi:hypothetical protein AB6A40_002299 [Gnathostoma spinigerum]|uniref:Apple domain-containing protein n=1 Tax=Gnathostoma spinigerum TaxID=75299 RepID=A0ABD6E679_9BILA
MLLIDLVIPLIILKVRSSSAIDEETIITGENAPLTSEVLCENRVSAFFVTDNAQLRLERYLTYERITETECQTICSNNRDKTGRFIICASFTYHALPETCHIYREKGKPDGPWQIESATGKRYYEKFCLPEDVSTECADKKFLRATQNVIIGYAKNVSVVSTIEECIHRCLKESFVCKSAMYFYEEGECITNTESASTKPAAYGNEESDKVIYVENGCLKVSTTQNSLEKDTLNVNMEKVDVSALLPSNPKLDDESEERIAGIVERTEAGKDIIYEVGTRKDAQQLNPNSNSQFKGDQASLISLNSIFNDTVSNVNSVPEMLSQGEESESRPFKAKSSSGDSFPTKFIPPKAVFAEVPTFNELNDDFLNSGTTAMNSGKIRSEINIRPLETVKIHNKDGSGILEHSKAPLPDESHNNKPNEEKIESQRFDGLPKETSTKGDQPNSSANLNSLDNKLGSITEEDNQLPLDGYFSQWSEWTPCLRPGERKIRRRRCLDLRRCIGGLMEVGACPNEIKQKFDVQQQRKTFVASGPMRPETPIPVSFGGADSSVSGAPPGILPHKVPVNERKTLPAGAPGTDGEEQIWSSWLGICQEFASGQPCRDNQMIGFESRECIAKEPKKCRGPFFRYCTIAC